MHVHVQVQSVLDPGASLMTTSRTYLPNESYGELMNQLASTQKHLYKILSTTE
jgi:hypothetical protein